MPGPSRLQPHRAFTRLAPLVLLGAVAALPHGAAAQSFDCHKASTAVETEICRNTALGALDAQLAKAFRGRLAAEPARRQALLTEQRSWVGQRDARCLKADGGGALGDCLVAAYRDRLTALQAPAPAAAAADARDTAVCRALGDKVRAQLASPAAKDASKGTSQGASLDPQKALVNLARTPSSGVTTTSELVADVDADKLKAWAARQTPPVTIPQELLDSIKANTDNRQDLDHPPGTDFYAVNGTAGTLACYQPGVYFQLANGAAKKASPPQSWDGESCRAVRWFGSVDGVPTAFEETTNGEGNGSYSLTVSPWRDGRFAGSCTLALRFSQRIQLMVPSEPDPAGSCKGGDCDALKTAVLALLDRVQAHATTVVAWRKAQIAALPRDQARQFAAMAELAADDGTTYSATVTSADDISERAPLLLPLSSNGRFYLVKAGHVQPRPDLTLPAWSVTIMQMTKGALEERTSFNFDMTSDRLLDLQVK